MDAKPKRTVTISLSLFCGFLAATFLGWLVAAFVFGRVSAEDISKVVSTLGVQLFTALFIGSTAGVAINWYLKQALGEGKPSDSDLSKYGISEIYPSRLEAGSTFLRIVQDKKVKKIFIAGFSLRDFLTLQGKLRGVWDAIGGRLQDEAQMELNPRDRLSVRLLLLDPVSAEGVFRREIEFPFKGMPGLLSDVKIGLEEALLMRGAIPTKHLEVNLYEHCPFSFMFLTDDQVFIEQYRYCDHRHPVSMPLLVYNSDNPLYKEYEFSFNTIWSRSYQREVIRDHVGTAKPIENAGIRNIFRRVDRELLSRREIECIGQTQPGEEVKILAVSGRFYRADTQAHQKLSEISSREEGKGCVKVKIAIINPVSKEAILRTVTEQVRTDDIRRTLARWTWSDHKQTQLYTDVHDTINAVNQWMQRARDFELRLYSCSIACALLLTPKSAFIEQYIFGRSRQREAGNVLGGEYPVLEYDFKQEIDEAHNVEKEIILSTFDIIWDTYSIEMVVFETIDEKEMFESNMARIKDEFML